jgi:hypothetical protein
MKVARIYFLAAAMLAALAIGLSPAKGSGLAVTLDRSDLMLGESATLSLKFEGFAPQNPPGLPAMAGLTIGPASQQTSTVINNGNMSSSTTFSFSVTPQHVGEFTIPAMAADVGGQRFNTQPIKLVVRKANAPSADAVNSGNEVAFLKLVLPTEKIYSGQTVLGRVELCLRDDVQNFGNFSFTATPAEGLSVGKMVEGQRTNERIGNHNYTVVSVMLPLTVVKSGTLELGPFTASVVVVLPSADERRSFFSPFGLGGEQRQLNLVTEQLKLQALPLPADNIPADFSGAIGSYSLNVSAGPTNLTVGDPVTVRVQISGRGALDAINLPTQNAWRDFKTYPPTATVSTSDQFGFQGTKTFEQIVTPLTADVHELPAFSFSFFNPDDGAYHTLTQPAIPLVVYAAGATPLPSIAATKNPGNENPSSPQDILPIKEALGKIQPAAAGQASDTPLITKPLFLAAQSLPVFALLAAFIWRKRADNLANNPRLRRRRAVAQLIREGLNDLKKFAAENKSEEFFALLFRLLQEQLGERLDCPATAITENVVEEHPSLRNAAPATLGNLRELFQLCNQARYAPVRGSSELNSVAGQFERTIAELQEVKA